MACGPEYQAEIISLRRPRRKNCRTCSGSFSEHCQDTFLNNLRTFTATRGLRELLQAPGIRASERSPLPPGVRKRPRRRVFRSYLAELQTEKDSMAEGSEFELPVPVSKLSDDSIMLEFATARRIALIARRLQCRAWRAWRKASVTGSDSLSRVLKNTN